MRMYFWIGLGSALGGMARYWLSGLIAGRYGDTFPWGTLIVNATGSFLIGLIAGATPTEGRTLIGPTMKQFLMLGVLGGYTTFSSFSLQTLNLAMEGGWFRSGLNVILSVAACLVAVWLGYAAGSLISQT